MLRVTADSNIYISALNFGGSPDKVLDLARSGAIELAISEPILEEVSRVLRDKFGWAEDAIALARERIADFAVHVVPVEIIEAVQDDPTDNRIIECAVAGGSDFLVTGDRHLLSLGQFGATRILKASEFLEIQSGTGKTE